MSALAEFGGLLDAAQAMGWLSANDVTSLLRRLEAEDGPGDDDDFSDPPDEEQEICPDCGGPADECEHSCPPTDEDRKAREDFGDPS